MKNYKRFYRGLKALYSLATDLNKTFLLDIEENREAERVLERHLQDSLKDRVHFVHDIIEDSEECIRYYTLDGVPALFVGYQDPISIHSGYFHGFTRIVGNDSLKKLIKSCY